MTSAPEPQINPPNFDTVRPELPHGFTGNLDAECEICGRARHDTIHHPPAQVQEFLNRQIRLSIERMIDGKIAAESVRIDARIDAVAAGALQDRSDCIKRDGEIANTLTHHRRALDALAKGEQAPEPIRVEPPIVYVPADFTDYTTAQLADIAKRATAEIQHRQKESTTP